MSDDAQRLLDRFGALERLAGRPGLRLTEGVALSRRTTFRIGGPAEVSAEVDSEPALVDLLIAARESGLPLTLLGLGSNVLAPDEGLSGVVVRLAGAFRRFAFRGQRVSVGAAVVLARLARAAAERGLAGLEALAGFPSTVGGAVYMNAGSYGAEMHDVVTSVRLVERDGRRRRVTMAALEPGYRETNLRQSRAIVTGVQLALRPGDSAALLGRMAELNAKRWAALPSGLPCAGSIFRNPAGDYAGRLIEACGLKGHRRGAAEISPKHANVIVNMGGATADDVLGLMIEIFETVAAKSGVRLVPEIELLGSLAERWRRATGGEGEAA